MQTSEARLSRLGQAAGLKGTSDKELATGFIQWIKKLKADIGIPKGLSAVGYKPELLAKLVDVAVADPCHGSNPREVARKDFESLYQRSI